MLEAMIAAAVSLQLVSVNTADVQADRSSDRASISRTGRYVAFESFATNLSRHTRPGADQSQIYLRDRRRGTTRLVSVNSRGRVSNEGSWMPSLSPNGRFVAFCSTGTNLARPDRHVPMRKLPPNLPPGTDVFVRDLHRGITRRASHDYRGGMANEASCAPSVSDTGDVAFESSASDLIPHDTNGFIETFVYDWSTRRVRAAAVPTGGGRSVGSAGAAISPDGRYVAFYTGSRLARGDKNAFSDVYLRDRRRRATRVMSHAANSCYNPGVLGVTRRARHVLYACSEGVRVLDRRSGRVWNASPTTDGRPPLSVLSAGMSADGRTVVFCSPAQNLAGYHGLGDDVFVWHAPRDATTALANAGNCSLTAGVSADGRVGMFAADMPGLVPADRRDPRQADVFVAAPLP